MDTATKFKAFRHSVLIKTSIALLGNYLCINLGILISNISQKNDREEETNDT